MSVSHDTAAEEIRQAVQALVDERLRLETWLARLEEQVDRGGADRLVERVRSDYLARLERVGDMLTVRLSAVRRELQESRTQLQDAQTHAATAGERLAEAYIRHRVGEFDAAVWAGQRDDLQREKAAAEAERERAVRSVSALERLVRDLEAAIEGTPGEQATDTPANTGSTRAAGPAPRPEQPKPPREGGPQGLWTALESADQGVSADDIFAEWSSEPEAAAPGEPAFPWEVNRSDEDEEGSAPTPDRRAVEKALENTEADPQKAGGGNAALAGLSIPALLALSNGGGGKANGGGVTGTSLYCRRCSAANDARSWYCEVCGSELV